jgi:spore coat protein U-like protein
VKTLAKTLVGFGILAAAGAASAQTASTSFQVLANVQASCSVSATNLDFGQYDPFATTAKDGSSSISVTCTNGTTYGVAVTNPTARSMAGPSGSTLAYGLYNDTNRTAAFNVPANSATGNGTAQAINVYGRIPVAQTSARPGNYNDTVNVTVTY